MDQAYKKRTAINDAIQVAVFVFFLLNLAIIGYFWWYGSGHELLHSSDGWVRALGRLFGLSAAFSIILDFALVARLPLMERAFGRAIQTQWHKWLGYAAFTFVMLHFSFLTVGYGAVDKLGLVPQFLSFVNTYADVLNALAAFLLLTAVVGLSIYFVRARVKYETWYYVHLLTYLAILLAFSHQMKVGPDFLLQPLFREYWWALYIALFTIIVVFRFLKPIIISLRHNLRVEKVTQESSEVFSVNLSGRNLAHIPYENGQFAIWWFLDNERFWQGHAFSLTSDAGREELRFTYKKSGDYTNTLDQVRAGTRVIMDGPYGCFIANASNNHKVLLIAGGIGITPLAAMLGPLIRQGRDIVLLYSARTEADLAMRAEIEAHAQQSNVKVIYIITNDPEYKGEVGKLDQAKLARLVPDAKDRAAYICGPPAMMTAISSSLRTLGTPKNNIYTENFSF